MPPVFRNIAAALGLALMLVASVNQALAFELAPMLSGGAPWWVPRANGIPAGVYGNCKTNQFYQAGIGRGSISQFVTLSRASVVYQDDSSGKWSSFASGTLRITDKGCLIEEARTNVVLWDRDLTNAAWTKSNVTAALDQTGIDGTANSATSLLATAGNGTAKQSITLASSARFQSAFVQRITGTGEVDMTMDNGTTWTAITPCAAGTAFGSSSCRVTIPTQTLANPIVGFRLVVNGDKIAVDFVQNENSGVSQTSPILTTTASVARALDVASLTTLSSYGSSYTLFGKGTANVPLGVGNNQFLASISDGTTNNRLSIARIAANGNVGAFVAAAGSNILNSQTGAITAGTSFKVAVTHAPSDSAVSSNGGAVVSNTTAGTVAAPTTMQLGLNGASSGPFDGYFESFAIFPTLRAPNGNLQSLTAAGSLADNDNEPVANDNLIFAQDIPKRQIWAEAGR